MSWKNDEARRQVFHALLIHKETSGEEETIALLSTELARLTVLREHRRTSSEILRLTQRVAELEGQIATAVDTLGFYADADNYEDRGGKPSVVRKDKGSDARDALKALGTDGGEAE